MYLDDIDIIDEGYEITSNAGGQIMRLPLMDEYPNPENTFDLMLPVEGDQKISSGDVAGAVAGVSTIISALSKSETGKMLKSRCGRRPVSKKKREKSGWNACKDKFYQELTASRIPPHLQPASGKILEQEISKKGLPMGAKVAIGFGIGFVVVVGGYFIIKRIRTAN